MLLEQKMAAWIDSHSVAQNMDWFDGIETTAVQADAGAVRWSTESVARAWLLPARLGVIKQ